jgi:hypothetical protein
MLQTVNLEVSTSNLDTAQVFRAFPHSLQANARIADRQTVTVSHSTYIQVSLVMPSKQPVSTP